ncbi:MAG: hypothetical protein IT324_10010 [Anaerolineae bacterium]|nr:hypothetical protein [Anaerolineae bacterium]
MSYNTMIDHLCNDMDSSVEAIKSTLLAWLESVRLQLGAFGAMYGVLVCVYLIAKQVIGERLAPIGLLNTGTHIILLGVFAAALAVLISPMHKRFYILYTLPGITMFVIWYGVLFLPFRGSAPDESKATLTVATFNIANSGVKYDQGAQIVRDIAADVYGFQELGWLGVTDLVKKEYPYQYYAEPLGIGIISRYPIDETTVQTFGKDQITESVAVRAIIELPDRKVSFYTVHLKRPTVELRPLSYDDQARHDGITMLVEAVKTDPYPVILVCDCNMSDQSEDHAKLSTVLRDSWREVGRGFGLTAPYATKDTPLLLLRSDYVWHSPDITALNAHVWSDSSSDHLPVVAQLDIGKK